MNDEAVKLTGITERDTTITVELPERAVRALAMLGQYGAGTLTNLVLKHISETEGKRHAVGFEQLQSIGAIATSALARLHDARAVAEGRMSAVPGNAVESVARAIYDAMPYDGAGVKPSWIAGGNSIKQDEARQLARRVLDGAR